LDQEYKEFVESMKEKAAGFKNNPLAVRNIPFPSMGRLCTSVCASMLTLQQPEKK
jgi:hypothetical protein